MTGEQAGVPGPMRAMPARVARGVAAVATALFIAACGQTGAGSEFPGRVQVAEQDDGLHGTLMDPPMPRPDLTLRSTEGERVALDDRPADEVTVLFFGYTHCPDVCPTTMADLAIARDGLPADTSDRVSVFFVSEDPGRDSPELLREWLDRFEPEFTGLLGGNAATARALKELYLPESVRVDEPLTAVVHPHESGRQGDGHGHEDYGVDHAGIVYAWGPGGRSVVYTGGTTPDQFAEDLERLATPS